MDYTGKGGNEIRSLGFGTTKSVFQADPGASSRAECHHGCPREYEQETCESFRASRRPLFVVQASIAERSA